MLIKRWLFLLLGIGLVLATSVTATPVIASANSIFPPILTQLVTQTKVPIFLPSFVPQEDYPLYATVTSVTPTEYEVVIGDRQNCNGGNYCRYGAVIGKKLSSSTPSIEHEYAFMKDPRYKPTERSSDLMGQIRLKNGLNAYFVPYICGASCDDAKVVWNYNGYRYLVGLKRSDKKTVVDMANSMVQVDGV
ncbi:hypothetical protein ABN584_25240 [Gloeocapsa sp. BRSZ]